MASQVRGSVRPALYWFLKVKFCLVPPPPHQKKTNLPGLCTGKKTQSFPESFPPRVLPCQVCPSPHSITSPMLHLQCPPPHLQLVIKGCRPPPSQWTGWGYTLSQWKFLKKVGTCQQTSPPDISTPLSLSPPTPLPPSLKWAKMDCSIYPFNW